MPANRLGHVSQGGPLTAPQLKVTQEFISLAAFGIFSALVLKERLRWTDAGAFLLIFSGKKACASPLAGRQLALSASAATRPLPEPSLLCRRSAQPVEQGPAAGTNQAGGGPSAGAGSAACPGRGGAPLEAQRLASAW